MTSKSDTTETQTERNYHFIGYLDEDGRDSRGRVDGRWLPEDKEYLASCNDGGVGSRDLTNTPITAVLFGENGFRNYGGMYDEERTHSMPFEKYRALGSPNDILVKLNSEEVVTAQARRK